MFYIQTQTTKGWRKLPDCKFSTYEKAKLYADKYWTTKDGAKLYQIVEEQS